MSIDLRVENMNLKRTVALQAEQIARLESMLQTDPMTGLLNRQGFLNHLNTMISSQSRSGGSTFVAFLDVDNFKRLNTEFTHDGGDFVLITLAQRFKAIMRQHDAIGRWSGDEFVIAFHLSIEDIACGIDTQIMRRISEYVRQPIISPAGVNMRTSCSFGIVQYTGGTQVTSKELIDAADGIMLETKQRDKGSITVVEYVGKIA